MQFTYRLSQDDFVDYAKLMQPLRTVRSLVMILAAVLAVLCFLLAAFLASTMLTQVTFTILGLAFVVVAFLYGLVARWTGKRMFSQNPDFSAERKVQFLEDGVISDT